MNNPQSKLLDRARLPIRIKRHNKKSWPKGAGFSGQNKRYLITF
jgi:hypothetical protein